MWTAFENYLQQRQLSASSVERIEQFRVHFLLWMQQKQQPIEAFNYALVMEYIAELRQQNLNTATIKHYVRYLKYMGGYLVKTGVLDLNPVINLKLQPCATPLPILLSEDELDFIYQAYYHNPRLNQRDKILLGLLCYQGIATTELNFLRVQDIDLESATLHLPKTNCHQQRNVPLQAQQILPLSRFIEGKKKVNLLIEYRNKQQGANARSWLVAQIKKELNKQQSPIQFKNLSQLRASRMALWIGKYGLRKAQYLAGHKSIHATERYQVQNLKELEAAINQYHPM